MFVFPECIKNNISGLTKFRKIFLLLLIIAVVSLSQWLSTLSTRQEVSPNQYNSSEPAGTWYDRKEKTNKSQQAQQNINRMADKSHAAQQNINRMADKSHAAQQNINRMADKSHAAQHNINRMAHKSHAAQHSINRMTDKVYKLRGDNLMKKVYTHSAKLRRNPKEIFNHSYFLPRDQILEDYNNQVLLQPKSGCGDSHQVHFIVASSPGDVNTRAAIRETWGSVARSLPWPGKNLSLSVRLTFILGVTNKTNSSLYPQDEEQWDDIVQFDMIDSYQNLTRKILLAMQWVVSSCNNVQYIVKVDQDNMANVPLLVSFLKHRGKNNSIYGYILGPGYVHRKGRWAVSTEAYEPAKYPAWASGTAYVVSRSAAETILKLCPYYSYVPIEDAFITGVLASIGSVDRFHVWGFTQHASSTPPACSFTRDSVFFGNSMNEKKLNKLWKQQVVAGTRRDLC